MASKLEHSTKKSGMTPIQWMFIFRATYLLARGIQRLWNGTTGRNSK
jgi:hypothetical protein